MSTKIAIFTEVEARGRTCHRTIQAYPTSGQPCVASQCMAWRWYATHVSQPGLPARGVPTGARDEDGRVLYRQEPAEPDSMKLVGDVYGYCGLAGDPMGWSAA